MITGYSLSFSAMKAKPGRNIPRLNMCKPITLNTPIPLLYHIS